MSLRRCSRAHQCDRFHGRMELQQISLVCPPGEGVNAGIAPDIAAIAPKAPELHIVAVPAAAGLEHEHELVLAAIERTHPAIVFDPDAEVQQLDVSLAPGGE